jgi:hypothetical protein
MAGGFHVGYAKNAALAEELRQVASQLTANCEKMDGVICRVIKAARTPADAYAFGRIASGSIENPFDQIADRQRYFAWKAGAKEGARTDTCRR